MTVVLLAVHPGTARAAYRVGPGDVLEIVVAQDETLSGKYAVRDDGALELELLGEVAVAGKTTDQVDEILTARLKKFYKAPSVRLSIAEYHSQKVYVLGAVAKPGTYVLQGEKSLLDAVLEAGGTTPASVGRILLMHGDAGPGATADGGGPGAKPLETMVTTPVDLEALLAGGASGRANVPLAAGDMVLVPGSEGLQASGGIVDATTASVTVVGEVAQPGIFRLERGATALAAVLAAGGVTKYAAPNRARVVRARDGGKKILSLELGDIMKHGEKKKDIKLEPGDMVIVPARLF